MNCSTLGLPVHHQLLEFTQTHAHRVGDAIQPSHPLSSPSSPAPNPCQHQGLFQWVNSSHEVAKVLEFQLQQQSFQWTPGLNSFRMDIVIKPPLLGNKASLVAETVKNSPVVWETWVWSLGWEDPLEEGMTAHSSVLVWRTPWTEDPGGLQSMGLQNRKWLSD